MVASIVGVGFGEGVSRVFLVLSRRCTPRSTGLLSRKEFPMDASLPQRSFSSLVVIPLLLLALVTAVLPAAVSAQAESSTDTERIPFDSVVFVPCANDGAGEYVELSGDLLALFHLTLDGTGGYHAKSHFNPQGISGVGLTTGDTYQGTGVTQEQVNIKPAFETTFINNSRIIGQGPGNNYLVHETFHITVTPNGDITAFVDNVSVECR